MKKNEEEIKQEFLEACCEGDLELFKEVLPFVDFSEYGTLGLMFAAREGFLEIAKMLIPLVNVQDYQSSSLRLAAEYGQPEIVKLLIPLSEAREKRSAALRFALLNDHHDIVDLLWDVSDIEDVLECFKDDGHPVSVYHEIETRWSAEKSKKSLKEVVSPSEKSLTKKQLKI